MYEQHFGLKKRPFRAKPTGTDVFVGPQTVSAIAGLKTALQVPDSAVAVKGPVGTGKTTLVSRALEAIGNQRIIVRLSRMTLSSEDVLEHLLVELGAENISGGAIRKFTEFRRLLKQHEESGIRVFVIVEDASRIGASTLAELEAVTAADAGESEGAALVLMGDERLDALLADPDLARLGQRLRQRHEIATLPLPELRGYLRHCFRLAGADFEQIFESDAADLLHHLGDGVPRTTNNLVESALSAAAAQGSSTVASSLLLQLAKDEFGLDASGYSKPAQQADPEPEETTVSADPEPEPAREFEPALEAEPTLEAEPEDVSVPDEVPVAEDDVAPEAEPEPVLVFANDEETPAVEPDIPELIQDTLPDLEVLAPELAAHDESPSTAAGSESPANEWDRDPTLAELKPDLDALEEAMAVAQGDKAEPPVLEVEAYIQATPEPEPVAEEIPEITLDNAISQQIRDKQIDATGSTPVPVVADAPSKSSKDKKADVEIEKIAAELAKAKSIEDVDDKMAETLFGAELNLVASQVIANPPTLEEPANDELQLVDDEEQLVAAAGSVSVPVEQQPEPLAEIPDAPAVEVTLAAEDSGMDLSASQRLKTVRALNADLHPSLAVPEEIAPTPDSALEDTPESIEDQINTSMTQTLEALNITPPDSDSDEGDEDEDEAPKSGFFSRFKRS